MAASTKRATLLRRLSMLAVGSLLALSVLGTSAGSVLGAGSVWTTQQTCAVPDVDQNTNQYMVYETVYLRGSGFDAGTYDWDITATGKGGATVASGSKTLSGPDKFCLTAHLILPAEEGSEFQVTFGGKHDNYQVKGVAATPTAPPVTAAPTGGGAGATLPPTDSVTGNITSADNLGLVLMLLAGVLASVMVLTPARARKR